MKIPYDIKRYEDAVRALEAREPVRGGLLLYGSSLLANWGYDRARAQLGTVCGLRVVNHGFGGAVADDALYMYHRLVRPYVPKAIVLRLGVNDINAGFAAEDAFDLTLRVLAWLRADDAGIPIALIGTFDYATCLEARRPHMAAYSGLCEDWARAHERAAMIDLNEFVYGPGAKAGCYHGFKDVFVQDGLHLSDAGYEQLAAWLKPRLVSWLERCAYG